MWKKGLSMLLSVSLLCAPYMGFALCLTDAEQEALAQEIANMRRELSALQMTFQLLRDSLKAQRRELAQAEQRLMETAKRLAEAEAELTKASHALEASEQDLLQLKSALTQARSELSGLQQAFNTLSASYKKQQKEKTVWMTATVTLALVVTGLTIVHITRR